MGKSGKFWIFLFALVVCIHSLQSHTILEEFNCKDSNIEYDASLKGGQLAGLFNTLGPVKNMQECSMKCCDHKDCDVAMLQGNTGTCIGVQCFNDSSCETVPAESFEDNLQIAHISGKGQHNIVDDSITIKHKKIKDSDELEARCPHNEVMYNMKLSGGLQAGKFTDIGRVKSIMTCVRYCCDELDTCDLAFMLGKRCYLVKCYTEDKCIPMPASGADYPFEQKMAFVSPWLYEKDKKIVKVPSGLQQHHLQCTQSKLYIKSKLLGGNEAGRYTHIGKVGKMHICSKLCCEDPECDLAYMFGKDCFTVKCFGEKGCRVLPDENLKKSEQQNFDKQIQFIVKRKYDVRVGGDGKIIKKENKCNLYGKIHNSTILEKGMLAGKLKTQHGINNMRQCIDRCCAEKDCHVAQMLGRQCYSMACVDAAACRPKSPPASITNQNPTIAYVQRGQITMAPPDTIAM